ncbi:DUF2894 domain-containing protein [Luteimonas yindakuii]|uniref:DUF2894 domain-containing protein n=1 Tax=Luteimonas yindakuii TaxID=2565782 RepID=UPI0010A2AA74|nr:DUF2894 domain-containing protein [Luteimonas yindakuii]QCO66614.1 DUF2894 domain-containing protein [Luteimonas yindakuii]
MAADAPAGIAGLRPVDALRRGHIDALRRRMEGADDALRDALAQRLLALEATPVERACCGHRPSADAASTAMFGPLLATLEQEARWRDAHAVDGVPSRAAYPALPALQPLRALWAQLRIEGQTREALAPATTDAGPLNSANLVHRALTLMRDASPGYLHHLMAYLDVLSAVEQMPAADTLRPANAAAPPAKKRARASRAKRK